MPLGRLSGGVPTPSSGAPQPVFRVNERSPAVVGHLEARRQDDRIGRARFFAQTAEDATQFVDLVARRVALTGRVPVFGVFSAPITVIALAGQAIAHSSQPMQRSLPSA